jgi:hypothetical protein
MPEDIRVFCNSCRRNTRHAIQQIFEYVRDDGQIVHWQTIQCGGCGDVSFYGTYKLEEGIADHAEGSIIYPPRLVRAARQFDGMLG